MNYFNEFIDDFERGINDDVLNIPLTRHCNTDDLSKLGSIVNVTKGMYTLIGGMSGSGKTSICDSVFLLNIYKWWKRNEENTSIKPYWIYRSMERTIKHKIAKWTCWLLYVDYGILLDVPTILQWSNKKRNLTTEEQELIKKYDSFFEEMFDKVDIKQGSENPTGIYKYCKNVLYQKGAYITSGSEGIFINGIKQADFNNDQCIDRNGLKIRYRDVTLYGKTHRIEEYDIRYVYRNPYEFIFHITDHVGKIKDERNFNDKQILDKHYEYMGELRDICHINPIDIVQLNRAVESHSRMRSYSKTKEQDISITSQDYKGSGDGIENADLVLGLLNPYKLNEMSYANYKIDKFVADGGENRFRAISVVKNSFGVDDIDIGNCFIGENGYIVEIPRADEFNSELYTACVNANKEILIN